MPGFFASKISKKHWYLLALSVAVSIITGYPRLRKGLPLGIDSTSHLYKVLFIQSWWTEKHIIPFWTTDWYAGTPSLLLYSPLGYFLALIVTFPGLDPITAYKLVDFAFYIVTPLAIYRLSRELGLARLEGSIAALLYSLTPQIIENYLFFDRFPTIIAIPLVCIFIIFINRILNPREPYDTSNKRIAGLNRRDWRIIRDTVTAAFLLGVIIITHHLSALIAAVISIIMVLAINSQKGEWLRGSISILSVFMGALVISAFWSLPFAVAIPEFSSNPFFNRNVKFPFVKFTYFSFDVISYLVGVAPFLLAVSASQSIVGRAYGKRVSFKLATFFPVLIIGMILFELSENFKIPALMRLSQAIIISGFALIIGLLIIHGRAAKAANASEILLVIWFISFLWISLGYYVVPIAWVPVLEFFWRSLDIYRFWLYLSIPVSMLAALGIIRIHRRMWPSRRHVEAIIMILIIVAVGSSAILDARMATTRTVNNLLPYTTTNDYIPQEVIEYFTSDPSEGRILAINCPLWIYVLPHYVNKQLIDGWYPQAKLIKPLLDITDYRINDLETTDVRANRIKIWRGLISQSELLGIEWIIIGPAISENRTGMDLELEGEVMRGSGFVKEMTFTYAGHELSIYKSNRPARLIETDPPINATLKMTRPRPDVIRLDIAGLNEPTLITIKEAYYPTWRASANGRELPVRSDNQTGYITIQYSPGIREITIHHEPNFEVFYQISMASIALLGVILVFAQIFSHAPLRYGCPLMEERRVAERESGKLSVKEDLSNDLVAKT
jgi:hypothetical protein